MLEIRHISDEEVDLQVGLAPLNSMSTLFIDDVLAVVERGSRKLPSYLDLYRKAVSQAWSPYELDFSQDREEWHELTAETKKRRTWSLRMFFAGEERVASLLAPLVWAAPSKDVEAFVASQLADEVRHTVLFDRYWREVVGTDAQDLHALVHQISVTEQENPAYRYLFYEWLPEQSQWLASHPTDVEATVKFVTVYHLIVEGALFLTGMRYQLEGARRWGVPGGSTRASLQLPAMSLSMCCSVCDICAIESQKVRNVLSRWFKTPFGSSNPCYRHEFLRRQTPGVCLAGAQR